MPDWEGDQDQLKVYYKTAAAGPWNLLTGATYTTSVAAWTQRTIALPNPNSSYYIAFEGNAKYGYGVSLDDVEVTGLDSPVPGVTVLESGGATAVTEGGAADTYTVVLTAPPSANVTATLSPGSQLALSTLSLVFTAATWSAPQTVTVSAVDDGLAEGTHSGTVTHLVSSSDASYAGIAVPTVTATITDDDATPLIAQGANVPATLDEDGSPSAWSPPLIAATDADGDVLTWARLSGPSHGSATVSGTGAVPTITYAPTADWNGSDSFVAEVSDGHGNLAAVTLSVTVRPRNDPPLNTAPPLVTGTHRFGQMLVVSDGAWSDARDTAVSGSSSLAVMPRWQRAEDDTGTLAADIPGATANAYTLAAADVGKFVRALVTAVDDGVGEPSSANAAVGTAWTRVAAATPVLTWAPPAALTYGEPLTVTQLNANADVPGTFTYTPAAGTVLAAGSRTLHLDFAPADPANYSAASAEVSLSVARTVLTITAPSASRLYRSPNPELTWVPTGFVNGDTAAVLSGTPALATGATLDSPVAGSPYPISVSQGTLAAANYTLAFAPGVLIIVPGTPQVTWPAPDPVEYGTTLGAPQLSAAANTAGILAYTPPAGTILERGTHRLLATFTPEDSANWTTTETERSLTVVDTTPAHITGLLPPAGATDVPRDAFLVLTFSETVLPGTGTLRIIDAEGVLFASMTPDGRGAVTIDGQRVSITPGPLAAGNVYHVLIDATCFHDVAGNAFAGIVDPAAWSFTVRPWQVTFAAGEHGALAGGAAELRVAAREGDLPPAPPLAIAATGWRFVGWEPALPATVTADALTTAQYVRAVWTLDYAADLHGSIAGPVQQTVFHGATGAAVAAVPDLGYVFAGWSDGSTANPRTDRDVVTPVAVTARFRLANGVPPQGSFLARLDAVGAGAGRGLWDLTGDYTTTVGGNALRLQMVHDPTGRLTGTATLHVATARAIIPVNLPIRGSVKGAGNARLATLTLQGANPDRTVSVTLAFNLGLNAAPRQLGGRVVGSLRLATVITPISEPVVLALPVPMDGTWSLLFELVAGGRSITGSALLTLSNGAGFHFVVKGKAEAGLAVLNLVGSPADLAARGLRISATIVTLEGSQARLQAASCRGYGQALLW